MATKMSLPGLGLMKGVGLGPLNVGNVLDTMGFVKKAWGAMNAPSAFMPTVDVEELKKRIVDLQAVEQWLVMNLGMIQTSIQALEVQRATIETLKGVTKGWVPGKAGVAQEPPMLTPEAIASTLFNMPASELSPGAGALNSGVSATPHAPPPKVRARPVARKAVEPAPGASTWLEFLQGQFNQVAQAAMSGASLKAAKKAGRAVVKKASESASLGASTGSRKKPTAKSGVRKPVAKKARSTK
jgi:hypothetical protein